MFQTQGHGYNEQMLRNMQIFLASDIPLFVGEEFMVREKPIRDKFIIWWKYIYPCGVGGWYKVNMVKTLQFRSRGPTRSMDTLLEPSPPETCPP